MGCGPHRNDSETSERTACRWLDVNRKLFHYASRRQPDEPLRSWLIERAGEHRRYGQRRLIVLARRAPALPTTISASSGLTRAQRFRCASGCGASSPLGAARSTNGQWSPTRMVAYAAGEFFRPARGYMRWIEEQASGKGGVDVQELHALLAHLQAAAAKLSAVAPSDAVEPQPDDQVEATSRHDALESKLPFDGYGVIFDPLDEGDQRRVEASLKNDLEDVYRDLSEGAALYIRHPY